MLMKTQQDTAAANVHPFEAAGLGKAPFRFVGMIHQDLCYGEAILNREEYERTGVRLTTKPGGSCDYCSTYIVNMYGIQSSDGRRFKVGCECVKKTGDAKLVSAVKRAAAKHNTKLRKAREARKIAAAKELLESDAVKAALSAEPHSNAWRAEQGDTAYDAMMWRWERSGNAGRIRIGKALAERFGG